MEKLIRITFLFVLLFTVLPKSVLAKKFFSVAPGIVFFDLSSRSTKAFLITNHSEDKLRLKITPVYFPLNSPSLSAGTPLEPGESTGDDLTSFILVSPRVVSLRPGQKRNVRVSVRAQKNLEIGDYRAHLLIQNTLNPPSKGSGKSSEGGFKVDLKIKLETAIAIYGRMGSPFQEDLELEWECKRSKPNQIQISLINKSKWRKTVWIGIYPAKAKNAKPAKPLALQNYITLRESIKRYSIPISEKSGEMRIRTGHFKDNLHKNVCFVK